MQVRLFAPRFAIFVFLAIALNFTPLTQAQTNQEALNEIRRAIELEEQRRAEYASLVTGSATTLETRGTNEVLQFSVDRLLTRNQTSKTIASLHIKSQTSENYIDDVLLLTSSRDDTVLGVDLSREMYLPRNITLIMPLGYTRGLKSEFHTEAAQQAPDSLQKS